ncbi:hypothetical protein CRYUN_Cryun12cG0035800 [Craigia yunnanensis]
MIPRSPCSRRLSSVRVLSTSDRSLQTFPPEHHLDIVRRRGGLIIFPARLITSPYLRFPVNEKRRPLLEETDPKFFSASLFASQPGKFKARGEADKFGVQEFLCLKHSSSVTYCGSDEANLASHSLFSLTKKFMEFLL